jgi:hypothetical protein
MRARLLVSLLGPAVHAAILCQHEVSALPIVFPANAGLSALHKNVKVENTPHQQNLAHTGLGLHPFLVTDPTYTRVRFINIVSSNDRIFGLLDIDGRIFREITSRGKSTKNCRWGFPDIPI